eukprot:5153881-Amphidinium_carterae.1
MEDKGKDAEPTTVPETTTPEAEDTTVPETTPEEKEKVESAQETTEGKAKSEDAVTNQMHGMRREPPHLCLCEPSRAHTLQRLKPTKLCFSRRSFRR